MSKAPGILGALASLGRFAVSLVWKKMPPPVEHGPDGQFQGGWNARRPSFMNPHQRRAWARRRAARA